MERDIPTPEKGRKNRSCWSGQELLAGSPSIDDLLARSEFQTLLRGLSKAIYYKLNLRRYDRSYSEDDLFSDSCEKMLKSRHTFRADNMPDEKALLSWLYVLVLNRGFSKLREIKRRKPAWMFKEDDENLPEREADADLERECAGTELMEFTKLLPEEHRRALMLWLEDHRYREIARILKSEGIKCSHVTVRKWVGKSLEFVASRASQ